MPYLAAARRGAPCLLLLLAACGSQGDADARLEARRAALGLGRERMSFAEAMKAIETKGYEATLARVGSKRLPPGQVLDMALDLENLLARADAATAEARPPDPPRFDSLLADARERALGFARAAAKGGTGQNEAGQLVAACTACHLTFRKPR